MMKGRLLLCVLLLCAPLYAANWYVDPLATGSNNGTSWANAWTSFGAISASVVGGDTVYISGGNVSQAYSVSNWTPRMGTSGAGPVTYKVGQDPGHTGTVTITASGDWLTGILHDVTIDGSVGGVSHWSVTAGGFIWYASNGNNARVRITYLTVPNAVGGFHWDTAVSTTNTAVEIDHSSFVNDHDWINGADNSFYGGAGTGPGQIKVHDNYIQFSMWTNNHSCGNDVWIWAENADFYNNTVRGVRRSTYTGVCPGASQHSDVFQTGGSNINFYNNTIIDPGESVYYQDTFGGASSNIKIYNNLIVHTFPCNSVERGFDMNPENNVSGVSFTDMVIANNTFVDSLCNFSVRVGGNANHVTPTRVYVVNNLEYPAANGFTTDPGVTVSNNYGGNGVQFVSYAANGGTNNDLHLKSTDTVAKDKGTNTVSSYFTTDKDGNARVVPWDIGAYEYQSGGGTHLISGTISGAGGNAATVALTGAATASTTADASGNYSFTNLADGSYTVTPTKAGYTMVPASLTVTLAGADKTGQNFTASAVDSTPPTVTMTSPAAGTVSGMITLTATCNDNVACTSVVFKRDANVTLFTDNASPWTTTFDTTTLSNGAHTLYATGFDAAGNNANAATVSVTVSNNPTITITPSTSHDFGTLRVNTTSASFGFTVTNNGPVDLHITTLVNGGANAADFTDSGTCPNATVPKNGGTCAINVTFTPSARLARGGNITINNSDGIAAGVITLTGTGKAPVASLSSASAFTAGVSKSTTQSLTLSNMGDDTLSVTSVADNSAEYSVATVPAGNCGGSIAAAGSCTINVTFTPQGLGSRPAGTLTVTDDSGAVAGTQQTTTLNGTGTHYSQIGMGGVGFTTIGALNVSLGTGENAYCGPRDNCDFGSDIGPVTLPQAGIYTGMDGTPSPVTPALTATSCADIQVKINSVAAGGTVIIPSTLSCETSSSTGLTFPVKAGNDIDHWVTVTTDHPLPEGTQATPCEIGQTSVPGYPDYPCSNPGVRMPTIAVNNNGLQLTNGASFYRLIGLNIAKKKDVGTNGCLVRADSGDHIIIDRSLIHGDPWSSTPKFDTHCGFSAKGTNLAVIHSWIYDIDEKDPDGQAVVGGVGNQTQEGPVKLYDDMLAGPSETWLLGGGGDRAYPCDYEIRHSLSMKPLMWMVPRGATVYNQSVNVKNLGEFKTGCRILVEDNVFWNIWDGGDQYGSSVLSMPKNQARYSSTKRVKTDGTTNVTCAETDGSDCAAGTGIWGNEIADVSYDAPSQTFSIHGLTNGDGVAWPYIGPKLHMVVQNINNGTLANLSGGGTWDMAQLNGDWIMGCNSSDVCTGDVYGSHLIYFTKADNPGLTLPSSSFTAAVMPAHTGMTQDYTSASCPFGGHCAFSSPYANYPANRIDHVVNNTHIVTVLPEDSSAGNTPPIGTHSSCRPGPEPDAEIHDLTIRYNYFSHSENIGLQVGNAVSQCGDSTKGVHHVSVHDNVFDDVDPNMYSRNDPNWGQGGRGFGIINSAPNPAVQTHDVLYAHNTTAGARNWKSTNSASHGALQAFGISDGFDVTYPGLTLQRVCNPSTHQDCKVTITFNNISGDSPALKMTVSGFISNGTYGQSLIDLNGTWDVDSQVDTYVKFTETGTHFDINPAITISAAATGAAVLNPPTSYYSNVTFRDNIGPSPVGLGKPSRGVLGSLNTYMCDSSTTTCGSTSVAQGDWTYKNNLLATAMYSGYPQGTASNYPAENPDTSPTCTLTGGCTVNDFTTVFTNWGAGRGMGDTSNNDYTVTAPNYQSAASDGKNMGADITRWKALKQAIMPHFTFTPLQMVTNSSLAPCTSGRFCEQQILWTGGTSFSYSPSFVLGHITSGALPTGMTFNNNDYQGSCDTTQPYTGGTVSRTNNTVTITFPAGTYVAPNSNIKISGFTGAHNDLNTLNASGGGISVALLSSSNTSIQYTAAGANVSSMTITDPVTGNFTRNGPYGCVAWIWGTPTGPTSSFTVELEDPSHAKTSKSFTLTVN